MICKIWKWMSNVIIRRFFPATASGGIGTTGLVAWWEMDETTGNRLDSHGSYDLIPAANSSFDTGIIGNAYKSTAAATSGLQLPAGSAFDDRLTDFSFSGWFYAPSTPGGFGTWLYSRRSGSGGTGNLYQLWWSASNRCMLRIWNNGSSTFTNTDLGGLIAGQFNFVAVSWNATTKECRYKVNGNSVGSFTLTGYDINHSSNMDVWVNSAGFGSLSMVDAMCDEMSHWHKILSDTEKDWLYNSGSGRRYSDL